MPGWLMNLSPFAQSHAGVFVAVGGRRGRLAVAVDGAAERVEVEFPNMHSATGVTVREVAFYTLERVGPPSDAELCAWWDGAVAKRNALLKVRRLPIRAPGTSLCTQSTRAY